ncbi:MAG TPA: VWA domain-containing protein [Thermoanaerobaculales bacterium]|nr:VWA domain-containing protein [Thermoanaerobaculales bacterium]
MERHHRAVVTTVVLAMLAVAAARPVALRVEATPVRPAGDATVVSVAIQVAPEDRARLGRDIWVQGELLRRGARVDRLARALDLDERGQATFEATWPPGEYDLRVEISGGKARVGGVWAGPLTVPSLGPAAPVPAAAQALPVAVAATTAAAPPPAAEALPAETEAAPQPEPAAAAEAAAEPAGEPPPAAAPAAVATAPTPAPVATAAPVPTAAAEPQPGKPTPAPPPEPVAETPAPEPAPEPPPVAASAVAPAAAPAAQGSTWTAARPGTSDLTVIVTERNRPIVGLGPSGFRLRVGGSEVTVEEVGDADSSPLNLAIVADVAADAGELLDEVSGQLGRFSLRTGDGGRLMVVTTGDPRPTWGATPDRIARWAEEAGQGRTDDLAGLVAAASQSFAGRRGRSFLVVVTDGRDSSGKAAWKDAAVAVEAAGVPVFVVGLRDSGFDDQARSALSRAADVSGGRSYFLGSAEMAGMTLDYVGDLIDASYALAFRPPAAGPGPREVKVDVANRDWQVHAPRRTP